MQNSDLIQFPDDTSVRLADIHLSYMHVKGDSYGFIAFLSFGYSI